MHETLSWHVRFDYLLKGRYLQSCNISTDWPGAKTVKESALPCSATLCGEYFTLTPVKAASVPLTPLIENVLVGVFERGPWGSLRSVKVSLPVLNRAADICKFSTPCTRSAPVNLRDKLGLADTEATRAEITTVKRVEGIL